MAKFAGLPWDLVMSAEFVRALQSPTPKPISAPQIAVPAAGAGDDGGAHNHDLKAGQKLGLKTAFVARPTEYGPLQKYDLKRKATGTSSRKTSADCRSDGVEVARVRTRCGALVPLRRAGTMRTGLWPGLAATAGVALARS